MTGKQIEAARKALPDNYKKMTTAQRRLDGELSCRTMINSCLIYGYSFYDPKTRQFGYYAGEYVRQLGEKTVIRLYEEQVKDFSRAVVRCGVFADSEGCVYNSCIWGDE